MQETKYMKQCSRFYKCNVPICPLDSLMEERVKLEGEEKCKYPKEKRRKIAEGSDLKFRGLTEWEFENERRWGK